MAVTKKGIPWKYCECGCKGSEARIGALYFWKYDDLRGTLYLNTEHLGGRDTMIGTRSTPEALDALVRESAKERSRTLNREARRTAQAVRQL